MSRQDDQAQAPQGWGRRDTLAALALVLAMAAGILATWAWQVMA